MYSFEQYQNDVGPTAIYKTPVWYPALKLTGEAGEVSEKIGKYLRDSPNISPHMTLVEAATAMRNDLDFVQSIKLELGDTLWYIRAVAEDLGLSLEEVAQANAAKQLSRLQRGTISGSGDNR